ncbi:EAL domain-containing protein [Marinobacterium aestuariivivens]|uniref:EAL domain-containing protein n=1 Tax=Marinobacterium aestuariivivens TaxID=1698799 RepID=A0ABW1ZY64_9GAMM
MSEKITYVRHFEPLGWIIGTGDYLFRILDDLKGSVLARLAERRLDRGAFFAVLSTDGRLVRFPDVRLSGSDEIHPVEALADPAVLEPLVAAGEAGGGFVEQQWRHPLTDVPAPVLLHVEPLPQAGWLLVAGIFGNEASPLLQQQRDELRGDLTQNATRLLVALGVAALVALLLSLLYARWLRGLFGRYQASIDEKQSVLERNAQQLQLAARVFDASREGIIISDAGNRIRAVNGAYETITGYSAGEAIGQDPGFMSSGRHDKAFYRELWNTLQSQGYWQGEVWNRRKSGEIYPEWLSISACRSDAGEVENYIATISDLSEHKRIEERLSYLANFDPLTDLPNRRQLEERVGQAIALTQRHPELGFALLLVGLDRFEYINDSLGHQAGDRLLKMLSQRLCRRVRREDTVFRLRGDVFAVLIQDDQSTVEAANLSRRLLSQMAAPIHHNGLDLVVTPSIGVVAYPGDGDDVQTLLRNGAAALHHAKAQGRHRLQFFEPGINDHISQRLKMEQALRLALSNRELSLHYQPQYSLRTGALTGFEALLRWHSAELGYVGPDRFIPLAEETGLIAPIGEWVLRSACEQGARWRAEGMEVAIAVNVSACQFRHDLPDLVASALESTGLPAGLLVIEVTETALMQDLEQTAAMLLQLRALGVRIALDDFGTGYSSLAYLKRLPLDKLKLDRAFIQSLPDDSDDTAIVRAMLDVARHLGLETVAEGIETPQQQAFLDGVGCAEGQGYLYARPMPAEQATDFMREAQIPAY